MLTASELRTVIKQAQGDAFVCTRFCSVGGRCGESGYTIHHNGLGPSDTGEQLVSAGWVLKLSEYQLLPWLTAWLIATHNGQHFDLNGHRCDRHAR
jgi:hypothetical protein